MPVNLTTQCAYREQKAWTWIGKERIPGGYGQSLRRHKAHLKARVQIQNARRNWHGCAEMCIIYWPVWMVRVQFLTP